MHCDIMGSNRLKLGLHHHTTLSDGAKTPEETAAMYKAAGYDAIAFTDHWLYGTSDTINGLPILPGAEYHTGKSDGFTGVYHILCLFSREEPKLDSSMTPQQIIDGIHAVGGLAVLAHPAWSLNTPENIQKLHGIDAIEIFNTSSGRGNSRREDSSILIDILASSGHFYPLLAVDDSHYYGAGNLADSCTAFIAVQCESADPEKIKKAILDGCFYASTGPEIHLSVKDSVAAVDCSECDEIVFLSNFVFSEGRTIVGCGITHGEYAIQPGETYIRAYATDSLGRRAWSNCIKL